MSRSLVALAALALICAAAVPTAAADYSDIMARMQNVVKANKTDIKDVMDNVNAATKKELVSKIIVCSTGQSSVDDSTIPGTCIKTNSTAGPFDLLTVQAVCPAGFQAVGGQCAFVPTTKNGQIATGAFAQGLSTQLRDPSVQGGDPAPTGLVTTQFCTGLQFQPTNGTFNGINAIGARAFCAPVKL